MQAQKTWTQEVRKKMAFLFSHLIYVHTNSYPDLSAFYSPRLQNFRFPELSSFICKIQAITWLQLRGAQFSIKKKAFLPTVLSTELPFFIRGKVSGNVLPPTFSVKLVGSASYRAGGCINWVVFTLCREKMCSFSCGLTTSIPLGVCNANNSPYFSYGAPMWIIAVLARWRFFVPGSRKAGALTLNDSVWKNLLEVVLSHAGVHPQFYSVYAGRSVGATASDSRPGEVSNPGACVHSSTLHIVLGTCLLCGTQDD